MNFDLSALDKLPVKKSGGRPSKFAPSATARPVSSTGLAGTTVACDVENCKC